MDLPSYPKFKALALEMQETVELITKQLPPYSDHHFTGMWCWDTQNQIKLSKLNGNIVFVLHDYITNAEFMSFIGLDKITETTDRLLADSEEKGYGKQLRLIPQEIAEALDPKKYVIEPEVDHFDYILDIEKAVDLKIRQNKSRRKQIRRFIEQHGGNAEIRLLDLEDPSVIIDIFSAFDRWSKGKKIPKNEIDSEKLAIERLITIRHKADLHVTGLYHSEQIIGFSIDELVDNEHAVGHFQKADTSFTGAYQYLDHHVNKVLHKKKIKFINIEQDLGIEALRTAKTGNHPHKLLKKFSVERAA